MAKAEILSIGTELLLGQILNTNSQFLSTELAAIGIDCLYHSTVGDNETRIQDAFRSALERCDVVISTGGLGPTSDDMTHESLAALFGVDMVFDEAIWEHIKLMFAKRKVPIPESNKKQAMRPAGADILHNPSGTAPGIIWKVQPALLEKIGIQDPKRPRLIFTFPGIPSEMHRMWQATVRSYLSTEFGDCIVWSRDLKHFGIGESTLAEKYQELLDGTNPTVAPLAGSGESRLRVTAKAATIDLAKSMAEPVIEKIRAGSGPLLYGFDDDTLESVVGKMLVARGMTISTAESCTGGLLSKRLTDVPGSSAYINLNAVTYSNEAKQKLLNVSEDVLSKYGAVSRECAMEMCEGVRDLSGSDIGVGITGIAGPEGGTAEKPVGLVFIGLASADRTFVLKRQYGESTGRPEIRHRSASDALNMVRLFLLGPHVLEEYMKPAAPTSGR